MGFYDLLPFDTIIIINLNFLCLPRKVNKYLDFDIIYNMKYHQDGILYKVHRKIAQSTLSFSISFVLDFPLRLCIISGVLKVDSFVICVIHSSEGNTNDLSL